MSNVSTKTLVIVEVGIGLDLLMTQSKALQLFAALDGAIECQTDYDTSVHERRWIACGRPDLRMQSVKASQVTFPTPAAPPKRRKPAES
jgi:hypothetical protein